MISTANLKYFNLVWLCPGEISPRFKVFFLFEIWLLPIVFCHLVRIHNDD